MTKTIRRNTAVFKQVARVLGARRARRELTRVLAKPTANFDDKSPSVVNSFLWRATPQGAGFWAKVHLCRTK